MTETTAHRQLVSATKLLLNRFEELVRSGNRRGRYMEDWRLITRTFGAIENSKEALNRLIGEPNDGR